MDLSSGNVQRLIATLQQARPGAAAGDRRGYSAPGVRHGSDERGAGSRIPRERTGRRERSRDQPICGEPPVPLGQQNGLDLEARFESIDDRLDTVERYIRLHAQTIAITDEVVADHRSKRKIVAMTSMLTKIGFKNPLGAWSAKSMIRSMSRKRRRPTSQR